MSAPAHAVRRRKSERSERHVARSLRVLHPDLVSGGGNGRAGADRLDHHRLSEPDPASARDGAERRPQALRPQRDGQRMSEQTASATAPRRRSFLMALPLLVFAALAALFWLRLGDGDPSRIPSALIGHPAPQIALPALAGLNDEGKEVPGLDPAVFKGKVTLVNVWASWCIPCHDEAPLLTELGKDKRLQMVGINYKDTADNARRFLGRYGNPFAVVGVRSEEHT